MVAPTPATTADRTAPSQRIGLATAALLTLLS
uniref:Uncharacterized protein n=1 Tax=Arundo donax TaxID=35708 RepID=A0A0A9AW95_ARUDO